MTKIINNRLEGAEFRQSPNTSGTIKGHKFLIIHQDFGTWEGTTSWLTNPQSKVSYHLFISKEGKVRQFVNLNQRAWHAGVSSWKGFSNLNDWGIGVCFQNRANEPYTDAQIKKGVEVCKAVMSHYKYEELLRHKDISPNRKTDPESPFPWEKFRQEVLDQSPKTETKQTNGDYNLRSGRGTSHSVITVLPKGSKVNIIEDKNGWSEVFVCDLGLHGYLSNKSFE